MQVFVDSVDQLAKRGALQDNAPNANRESIMSDVFISYSRKDSDFVRQLHNALAVLDRDVWVDWEDIPLTADWWREICTGIANPPAARSHACIAWSARRGCRRGP